MMSNNDSDLSGNMFFLLSLAVPGQIS